MKIKEKFYTLVLRLYEWLGRMLTDKSEREHERALVAVSRLKQLGITACTGADTFPPGNPGSVMIDKESLENWIKERSKNGH
jgi:hypothetical protein